MIILCYALVGAPYAVR